MNTFSKSAKNVSDLSFEEQVVVVLIEILDRVTQGKESDASVSHVLGDLFNLLPWVGLSTTDVEEYAFRVANKGVTELPGYPIECKPEGVDSGNTDAGTPETSKGK